VVVITTRIIHKADKNILPGGRDHETAHEFATRKADAYIRKMRRPVDAAVVAGVYLSAYRSHELRQQEVEA